LLGTRKLMEENGVSFEILEPEMRAFEEDGKTAMLVAYEKKIIGIVAVADTLKENSREAVETLAKMGIEVAMITGDNAITAGAIARQVGISRVLAEVLPEDKANEVKKLQDEGKLVGMVGDGINDAPALVQSDVGIALGAGTDVAMESAGVVLVSDQMGKVVSAIVLGRASYRKMKQNIAIALLANVIGMTLAILGLVTVPVAIAIITASIFAVLLPPLSLLRLRLDVPEATATEESVVETVIPARRMHCENCSRKIRETLSAARGVRKVVPDVARKEVLVAYRPDETSEAALRHQLEAMGFR